MSCFKINDIETGNEIIEETVHVDNDIVSHFNEKTMRIVDPIFHDDVRYAVILLDISMNKEWLTYITHQRVEGNENIMYAMNNNHQIQTYLTRRKFYEVIIKQASDNDTLTSNPEYNTHVSVDITHLIKDFGPNHCKFLSISPDGKYVALSFYYKRNSTGGVDSCLAQNKNCLIFKVDDNSGFSLHAEKHCNGRAVFVGQERSYSLVLMNMNYIEVYAEFPDITEPSYVLDLAQFLPSIQDHKELCIDDMHTQNSSWVCTQGLRDNIEMKRIMSLSRHIQHGTITTHFTDGLSRLWSLTENGTLITAFHALHENIMMISRSSNYVATVPTDNTHIINIYNVKSGLRIYQLRSQAEENFNMEFTVSHIDFFYNDRYVAMTYFEGDHVVFEVWYMEAEKSIYRISKPIDMTSFSLPSKWIQPFVTCQVNEEDQLCLKGVYACFQQNVPSTHVIELDIDEINIETKIEWINNEGNTLPFIGGGYEIYNNLNDESELKCAYLTLHEKRYLLRFGQHTVQLWKLSSINCTKDTLITKEDELIYIRAYMGPNYGANYSFRDNWEIHHFDSIRCIDGVSSGRFLVNITQSIPTKYEFKSTYHTEELFLPLYLLTSEPSDTSATDASITPGLSEDTSKQKSFDYHRFESACQALYFLTFYKSSSPTKNKRNYTMLLSKTKDIIDSTTKDLRKDSNHFSTIASSKTLAMLASFESGRNIIKTLISIELPIIILSYPSSTVVPVKKNDILWHHEQKGHSSYFSENSNSDTSTFPQTRLSLFNGVTDNGMLSQVKYRNSYQEDQCVNEQVSRGNENVLTVLIKENEDDLFKLLFNRILHHSKLLGPGALLALTDALLFLQKEGNSDLLLKSSKKLSFLVIKKEKLHAQKFEINQIERTHHDKKEIIKGSFKVSTLPEQIRTYGKWRQRMDRWKQDFYTNRVSQETRSLCTRWYVSFVNKSSKLFQGTRDNTWHSYQVCILQLPYATYDPTHQSIRTDKDNLKSKINFPDNSYQQQNNIYRQSEMAQKVILQYKYEQFIRRRMLCLFFIHILYYVTFSTGVVFSQELNHNIVGTGFRIRSGGQIASISLMCITSFLLMLQKVYQFWNSSNKLKWLCSVYHWIDIAAVILPVFTFIHMINGWNRFSEICSATTLILWLHGILRLRVHPSFGPIIETVIQTGRLVRSVIIVMLTVVFVFTNTNMVLIHLKPDEYYEENYNVIYSGVVGTDSSFGHSSGSYGFSNVFRSFSQICYFIYGSWDPANDGTAVESIIFIKVVSILFSVMTLLMLFNLLITIRANRLDDIRGVARDIWFENFSTVAFELESYFRPKDARTFSLENPTHVYYLVTEEGVRDHEEKLDKETKDLLKKLKIGNSTTNTPPCACCKKP